MLTLTDLFCGAGGSPTGALDVPGVQMLGNAVTPNAARDLVAMAVEALTGQELEPAPPQAAPTA